MNLPAQNPVFRVLGPVEFVVSGVGVPFARPQHRALLALLILQPNRMVTSERIIDGLWGDDSPATAAAQVHNMVSAIRSRLRTAADDLAALERRGRGYMLRVDENLVDVASFRGLVAQAKEAADDRRAVELLRSAMGRWRGPPLADVDAAYVAAARVHLEEQRAAAAELLFDAELRLGRHSTAIAEITAEVVRHPLRERFIIQLMTALYRDGRQAEALHTYREARAVLADGHGLEPGPALQNIERRILRRDSTLDWAPTAVQPVTPAVAGEAVAPSGIEADGGTTAITVPHQLPVPPRYFVGRTAELKDLTRLAHEATDGTPGAMVIATVSGPGGIGKTALALHWAHQVADMFPDGQVYLNLRGYDPSGEPMTRVDAIRCLLDAFGLPSWRIPHGFDAQANLYRTLVAGQRLLVVLDNARAADQVRPLLPGTSGALVLVTSRDQLVGLAAAEGAHQVKLDLLSTGEAYDLLTRHLGPERTTSERTATEEIILRCARLPLALSIVAARAATRPNFPMATVAGELAGAGRLLDALDTHDRATQPRSVFSWSYQDLDESAARLFRLLSVHPGPDIALPAMTSLAGIPAAFCRRSLGELVDAHMLTEQRPGRYNQHDLLRAYAAEQAGVGGGGHERRAALHRILDHYLHSAYAAAGRFNPYQDTMVLAPVQPGVVPEDLGDTPEAFTWFEAEVPALLALVGQAADAGFDHHATQLAWTLTEFLDRRGRWQDWLAVQELSLAAARRIQDHLARARAHRSLGRAHFSLSQYQEAFTHHHHALDLYAAAGDHIGQAHSHFNLSRVLSDQGRYADALRHATDAAEHYLAGGHHAGHASALNSVGWLLCLLGDYQQALDRCGRALELQTELDNIEGQCATLDSIGYINHHLGNYAEAIRWFRRGLALEPQVGNQWSLAQTLAHLGDAYQAAGEVADARAAWQQALAILGELGRPDAAEVQARLDRFR